MHSTPFVGRPTLVEVLIVSCLTFLISDLCQTVEQFVNGTLQLDVRIRIYYDVDLQSDTGSTMVPSVQRNRAG